MDLEMSAAPEGFVVVIGPDRIHFLDWGGPVAPGPGVPTEPPRRPGVLLVHGLAQTSWSWAPVARRLRRHAHVVAMDLRGHGLSDAPTEGYDPDTLADDVLAVAEGSGLLLPPDREGDPDVGPEGRPLVLAGHGFGACVAAWAAAMLGDRCAALVLVDGGWEDVASASGVEPAEFARSIEEPPEVLRSMAAFLADRAAFDPGTWDADQERAARSTVVEVPAGHVVPAVRPHALARSVEAMFGYRPAVVLPSVEAPIVALVAASADPAAHAGGLAEAQATLLLAGRPPMRVVDLSPAGHNLMRYRPDDVVATTLEAGGNGAPGSTMRS
ncbi:MAG TPA: alpha/beta fold hydrolase [Candidatus Limnocylindrales bacterium]